MRKKRILHCINGMGSGGAEKDLINWMKEIYKKDIYFDFLIRSNDVFFYDEIKAANGEIYIVSSFPRHFLKNIIETNRFFKKNHDKYYAIHVHGNTTFYILPLIFAKKYKIPIRIFHMHNTKSANIFSNFLHIFNRNLLPSYVTHNLACSKEAAEFAKMKNPIIIKNMINKEDFYPIKNGVNEIKEKYKLNNYKNIFIHVGKFLEVKNHKFLLDVFKSILMKEPSSCLLLVGIGPLFDEIQSLVIQKKIAQNVFFIGETSKVNELINIADLMIFPSLYEGIPLVMIEAQATGTKVLASDKIDVESAITPYVKFMKLACGADIWAKEAINFLNDSIICDINDCFKKADYDFNDQIEHLVTIYRGEK